MKKPEKNSTEIMKVFSAKTILETEYGEDEWLIQDLITAETITVIAGSPASCKTWVCLHLAFCVANGEPFLGHFAIPKKLKVLIVDKENRDRHMKKRMQMMDANPDSSVGFTFYSNLYIDDSEVFEKLVKYVKENSVGLVIFDSLIRFHRGDENDSRQIAVVLERVRKLVDVGANVIFTHHHRKEPTGSRASANSLRGSSDISAAVDVHIAIERKRDDEILVFRQHKLRQAMEQEPFTVKVVIDEEAKKFSLNFIGDYDAQKEKRDGTKVAVMDLLDSGSEEVKEFLPVRRISELLEGEYSDSLLRSALVELKTEKLITKEVVGSNKHLYKSAKKIVELPDK